METIGKYKITGKLGAGGFGQVYKALDPSLDLQVAIKVLNVNVQDDAAMVGRFRAEARVSAKLRHKNIVTVYDFEQEGRMQYLVMEYLEGQNLQELLDQKVSLPVLDKLHLMSEVAEGLQYAHEHGVIHRDIKPANIMRLIDGSVKIMDFGIARLTQKATRFTQAGYLVGTPQYMAPEQIVDGSSDAQTDVWAYGVVLYELLTGVNPFHAENAVSIIYRITREEPPPLSDSVLKVPRAFDPVIRRLLAKSRDERYPSMEDVRLDLAPVIQELEKAQVAGLEKQVEALIGMERYDEAQGIVARILKLDNRNSKARIWRGELREFIRRQSDKARIRALVDEAEALVIRRDFGIAEARLQEALQMDRDNSAIRARIREVRAERDKTARAERLLAEARLDLERQALTSAFEHANEASSTDPASSEAAALLDQIRKAIAERDAEARRKSDLSKARGLLLVQDYAGAVSVLQELARQHPADANVRTRLEEALRLQSADAAIAKSRDHLLRSEFQPALDVLSALDPESADNPQVQQLLAFAREQLELQRRERECNRLLAQAEAAGNDFDRALSLIGRALDISSASEKALHLRKTVLARRQAEVQDRAFQREIDECRLALQTGNLEEAQTRVQKLQTRYPGRGAVPELVSQIAARLEQRQEAQAREAVESILTRVRTLAAVGGWDDAGAVLDAALQQFPRSAPLADERKRIAKEAELQALLTDIRQKITRREFGSAVAAAESGIGKFPDARQLSDLLRQARQLLDRDDLLRRAEAFVAAGQTDQAEEALRPLAAEVSSDPDVERLMRFVKAQLHRRQTLDSANQLRKRFEFSQARETLLSLLRDDPNDGMVRALLEALDREAADYARRQMIAAARAEAARLFKSKDYAAVVGVLAPLAQTFPDDSEIQDDLRRARDLQDQSSQQDAFKRGRGEFNALMRTRSFDQAIAKVRELIAAFPNEPDLQDELRRVTEARDLAARRELSLRGRKEIGELLKSRMFDQAVTKAEELAASFPEDPDLQDELVRTRVARDQAARQKDYTAKRKEIDALMKNGRFEQAAAAAGQLLADFPDEPELRDILSRAREAHDRATRQQTYAAKRKNIDGLMKGGGFGQATTAAEQLLADFPDELELRDILNRAREARDRATRQQTYSTERKKIDGLMKDGRFEQAAAAAEQLLADFPDEAELRDILSRAREARDRAVRKQAYLQGRQEFEDYMRGRQFARAVARAEELAAAFPEEPGAPNDLKRAQDAHEQAERQTAYDHGRKEFDGLMREGRWDQAIAHAQELLRAFPDDPAIQNDLRRARDALRNATTKTAYDRHREEFEALMKAGRYQEAVAKAEALATKSPDDPVVRQNLQASRSALELRQRNAELEPLIAELESLFRKGDAAAVKQRGQKILQKYDDPRARELLAWAERLQADLNALKREAAPTKGFRRPLLGLAGVAAALLLGFGIYEILKPAAPGQLRASVPEVSFTYQIGGAPPQAASFDIASPPHTNWTASPSDSWFKVAPVARTGSSSVAISVNPGKLVAGEYSGIATIQAADGSAAPVSVRVKLLVKIKTPEVAVNGTPRPEPATPPKPLPQVIPRASAEPPKQSKAVESKPEDTKPQETKPVETPAVQPNPPPPPEPSVDCHAANYFGLSRGNLFWVGTLEPGQSVTIDRHNKVLPGGRVRGDHIPGCAITVTPVTSGIAVTEPEAADNFATITIRNTGSAPINSPGFEWRIK